MTINNPERFVAGLWDWAILDGCFGNTKIRPTDIDGNVERNNFFLFLETKAPGVELNQGQERDFLALSKLEFDGIPRVTVCIVWGKKGKPERAQFYINGETFGTYQCSLKGLREFVSTWFEDAEANRPFTLGRRS